ncbi:MAG: hypothetical protein WCK92_13765, partial [Bacteroidota bacterium]
MGKQFFILLIFLACGLMSKAQVDKEFEEMKKAQEKELGQFVEKTQGEFNQYADSIDKEFSDYLRKNWAEFEVFAGTRPDTTPKPKALPKFNPAVDKIKPGATPREIEVTIPPPDQGINPLPVPVTPFVAREEPPDTTAATPEPVEKKPEPGEKKPPVEPPPDVKKPPSEPAPSVKPVPATEPVIKPVPAPAVKPSGEPVPAKKPAPGPKAKPGSGNDFYGAKFAFHCDPEMNGSLPAQIHNTTIADFWDRLNNTSYSPLLQQLNDTRTAMNLNDWGFFLLVKKTSEAINPDKNYSRLLSWFLLTKSGYRIRVAYTDNQVALMFPSSNTLYDTRFFITDNIKFYAPDFNENVVLTYAKDFPGATR